MDTATKKIVNHAINHLSDRQFLVRTADEWNDLESAKHILRELRDHGEVYLHSKAMQVVSWAFPELRERAGTPQG